ncbi:hypothetical protein [Streptomyces xinghaiensis]|uniref:hypothetical protein n=1 Tax=Streptomyces xinghaiensis TaxID=1038928 RepID=UPI002E154462|nr:hypothetical protein OG463_08465 [Streptomyces xinghaiensis]
MIKPEAIPQFTGDLGQLEKDATGLGNDADDIRETGKGVHTQFQGLSAFYTAPEAEALFASTKPVQDRADEFADDLEKVKSALDEYAAEVRPLVAKLKQLKADAAAFVASVEDDDEWKYDGDKIDEHNALQSDVTATVAAFWEAERTAANKITALVGGTQYRANDGSDGKNMYGFSADDMKDAEVPWGTAENEKYHWYEVHQHIKSFVWDGLIVDGVWGTIKGLGTLVGFDGWDAMKDAWKGLGMLVVGTALYTSPLAYAIPDSALPQWMKDSKEVAKQTGKALLAWDTWSENPARAAGAVTFNVLTSITGAGNIAKGGTVAKVASVAGKAGKFLDPMTHISSVVGKAGQAMKIGDVLAGLKNLNLGKIDIPAIPDGATLLPDGRLELPDGTVKVPDTPLQLADGTVHVPEGTAPRVPSELPSGAVLMPDGSVLHPDGRLQLPDGSTSTVDVPVEPHKAELANPDRAAVRVPEQELVGAGARSNPPGAVAQVGDAGNPSAVADNTVGGGNPAQVGANAGDNLPTASTNPGGPAAPGAGGPDVGGPGNSGTSGASQAGPTTTGGGSPTGSDTPGNGLSESDNTGGGAAPEILPPTQGELGAGGEAGAGGTGAGGGDGREGGTTGEGGDGPHLIRQDDSFHSEHNYKGQRKSHLNSHGDLVPANPDGEAGVVDHIVGRDPAKSDSPYTSLSREGADAKDFGSGRIRVDLARLEADIAAGKVRGVEVFPPEKVQAALQENANRIAGHEIDLSVPPGTTRAEAIEIAKERGLSNSKAKRIGQRMIDMMNTRRDEEWLIKGVVPNEYITGPFGGKS